MKDPFEAYKLPLGLSEGVEIPLKGTPAVFTVTLPSNSNDEYQVRLMSNLNISRNEDGTGRIDMPAHEFQNRRKAVFFESCIVKAVGLPEGMEAKEFFDKYPLAGRAVFEEALRLGDIADKEVDAALGKFENLQSGKSSGEESSSNTKPLKKAASPSKQSALN